MEFIPPIGNS
ncbi:3f7bfdd3-cc26-4462-8cd4-d48df7c7693d [Thermothielavioides terrestris]|uniref:3f7bfdd3-cc26-4462-8cd4-d48df7c7693d n=1 Tax=Thermothielavioides terrestris TaxID=2587410 RepID=A0A3S4AQT8_9PEZI|nr:3f7bfdd3-cc26-4462-8cd4-d48df7c7693d [Thermothielavioides terrestris]